MEIYKYEEEYQKVVNESKAILDGAKAQYESMAKKYNEKTLQAEAGALLRKTNEELLSIKRTFIAEATQKLEDNKQLIQERRELVQQGKTTQDKILEQLTQANTIQELEAQLIMVTNTGELLEILDSITDPTVFNVIQAKAFTLVNNEGKTLIKNKKYHDVELDDINQAMAQVKYMDRAFLSPILPLGVDSVESYVTGTNISDYYFGGGVK